jgi:hypothetical protein
MKRWTNMRGYSWDAGRGHWQIVLQIHGKQYHLGTFKDQEEAARFSDQANWFFQDLRKRRPHFNFPEELPPPGAVPRRIADIRRELLSLGYPNPFKHHPEWITPESQGLL